MNRGSYCGELVGKSAKGHVVRGRMAGTGDPAIAPPKKMVCKATLCLALQPKPLAGVSTPPWCAHRASPRVAAPGTELPRTPFFFGGAIAGSPVPAMRPRTPWPFALLPTSSPQYDLRFMLPFGVGFAFGAGFEFAVDFGAGFGFGVGCAAEDRAILKKIYLLYNT